MSLVTSSTPVLSHQWLCHTSSPLNPHPTKSTLSISKLTYFTSEILLPLHKKFHILLPHPTNVSTSLSSPLGEGKKHPSCPSCLWSWLCCGCHLTVLLWNLASPITQLLNPRPRPLLLFQPFTPQEYTNAPISYGKKPTNEQKPFLTSTSSSNSPFSLQPNSLK